MSLIHRIRIYHASLGGGAILAFLTGDFGVIHDWIGYAVAAVIVFRLVWAVFNPRQLGLNRFYPDFEGLRFDNVFRHQAVSKALILGIAVSLIGATITGIFIAGDNGSGDGFMEEVHEVFSNLMIFFVVLHAAYLLMFKRPLARFMLYRDRPRNR